MHPWILCVIFWGSVRSSSTLYRNAKKKRKILGVLICKRSLYIGHSERCLVYNMPRPKKTILSRSLPLCPVVLSQCGLSCPYQTGTILPTRVMLYAQPHGPSRWKRWAVRQIAPWEKKRKCTRSDGNANSNFLRCYDVPLTDLPQRSPLPFLRGIWSLLSPAPGDTAREYLQFTAEKVAVWWRTNCIFVCRDFRQGDHPWWRLPVPGTRSTLWGLWLTAPLHHNWYVKGHKKSPRLQEDRCSYFYQ